MVTTGSSLYTSPLSLQQGELQRNHMPVLVLKEKHTKKGIIIIIEPGIFPNLRCWDNCQNSRTFQLRTSMFNSSTLVDHSRVLYFLSTAGYTKTMLPHFLSRLEPCTTKGSSHQANASSMSKVTNPQFNDWMMQVTHCFCFSLNRNKWKIDRKEIHS